MAADQIEEGVNKPNLRGAAIGGHANGDERSKKHSTEDHVLKTPGLSDAEQRAILARRPPSQST